MGGAERVLPLPEAIIRLLPSSGGTPTRTRADPHRREALSVSHLRDSLPPPTDPQKPRSHPYRREAIPRGYPIRPSSYPPTYTQAGPGFATIARFLRNRRRESGAWIWEKGGGKYIPGLGTVVPRDLRVLMLLLSKARPTSRAPRRNYKSVDAKGLSSES